MQIVCINMIIFSSLFLFLKKKKIDILMIYDVVTNLILKLYLNYS